MPGRRASHDVAGLFAGAVISMIVMTAGWSSAVLAEGEQVTDQAAKQGTPPAAEGPAIDVAATAVAEIEWQEKISSIGVAEAVQGVDVSGSEAGRGRRDPVRFRQRSESRRASGPAGQQQGAGRPQGDAGADSRSRGRPQAQAAAGEGKGRLANRLGRRAVEIRFPDRPVDLSHGNDRSAPHHCAVRRGARHPQGQPGTVSASRRPDRQPAGSVRHAHAVPGRAEGFRQDQAGTGDRRAIRCLSERGVQRAHHRDRAVREIYQRHHPDPGGDSELRHEAAARHVCQPGRAAARSWQEDRGAAKRGDIQPLWRDRPT